MYKIAPAKVITFEETLFALPYIKHSFFIADMCHKILFSSNILADWVSVRDIIENQVNFKQV